MDSKITKQVEREVKRGAKPLKTSMLILAIILLAMGILFNRGFFLPCFLFALLYFVFDYQMSREYEYVLEDGVFTVAVIKGKRRRKEAHRILMKDVEVVAHHLSDRVAKYRKGSGVEKVPKYDYTSYNDDIPYYTMIAMENKRKVKLLLDLDEELLTAIRRYDPLKVEMTLNGGG